MNPQDSMRWEAVRIFTEQPLRAGPSPHLTWSGPWNSPVRYGLLAKSSRSGILPKNYRQPPLPPKLYSEMLSKAFSH